MSEGMKGICVTVGGIVMFAYIMYAISIGTIEGKFGQELHRANSPVLFDLLVIFCLLMALWATISGVITYSRR